MTEYKRVMIVGLKKMMIVIKMIKVMMMVVMKMTGMMITVTMPPTEINSKLSGRKHLLARPR